MSVCACICVFATFVKRNERCVHCVHYRTDLHACSLVTPRVACCQHLACPPQVMPEYKNLFLGERAPRVRRAYSRGLAVGWHVSGLRAVSVHTLQGVAN